MFDLVQICGIGLRNSLDSLQRRTRAAPFVYVALAIFAVTLMTAPRTSRAEELQLRLEHFMPEASVQQTEFFLPWARRIEAASKGQIRISVTPAMGLGGKPEELLSQLEEAKIDIAWISAGWTPGRFPKLSVFELPWVVSSRAAVTSMALQEYAETYARDELANIHVLAVWSHSSGVIMTRDREVLVPSDLKGLRIRTPSAQLSSMLSTLGAEPKLVPAPLMIAELDRGNLDGTVFPYEVIPTFRLQDRLHRIAEFAGDRGLYTAVFILAMNADTYRRLPASLRQIIDENSGMKLAAELGRLWDEFETAGRDAYQAGGGTVTFVKGAQYEDWLRQTLPVVDAWVRQQNERGNDGALLLKSARALIEKYSRLWAPDHG